MYNSLKAFLFGISLLSSAMNAKASYTYQNGSFNLGGSWVWDDQTRTAWCNNTSSNSSSTGFASLSFSDYMQITLAVVVAPVLKEKILDPVLEHYVGPVPKESLMLIF